MIYCKGDVHEFYKCKTLICLRERSPQLLWNEIGEIKNPPLGRDVFQVHPFRVVKDELEEDAIFYAVSLIIISLSLLITPSYASEKRTMVHVETSDLVWQRTAESTVSFRVNLLSKLFTNFRLEYHVSFELNESAIRNTTITFDIYSNDVYVNRHTHSIYVGSGVFGDFGDEILPSRTLRTGENEARILLILNSTTSEPPSQPDIFHMTIYTVVKADNYKLAGVLTAVFIPIGVLIRYGKDSLTKGKRRY